MLSSTLIFSSLSLFSVSLAAPQAYGAPTPTAAPVVSSTTCTDTTTTPPVVYSTVAPAVSSTTCTDATTTPVVESTVAPAVSSTTCTDATATPPVVESTVAPVESSTQQAAYDMSTADAQVSTETAAPIYSGAESVGASNIVGAILVLLAAL